MRFLVWKFSMEQFYLELQFQSEDDSNYFQLLMEILRDSAPRDLLHFMKGALSFFPPSAT
jgi:hypothetical protein